MKGSGHRRDLEAIPAYAEASEIASFVHDLQDRFPDDQIATLYGSLRSSSLALGARIAEGYGRDGLDDRGCLSEETRRQTMGVLYRLRHYASVSAAQFYLDENQVANLDALCANLERVLSGPAGQAAATSRGGSDE